MKSGLAFLAGPALGLEFVRYVHSKVHSRVHRVQTEAFLAGLALGLD
jgi:hypothetical protein